MRLRAVVHHTLLGLLALAGAQLLAEAPKRDVRMDAAVTYAPQRSQQALTTQRFWLQGGAVALGATVWRGFGPVVELTSAHSGSIAASGLPVSLMTVTFGSRYRWRSGRRTSLYGQGLLGLANGYQGFYPVAGSARMTAHGLATNVGVGVDLAISPHFAVRALEVGWVRTRLPNAADNVQNNFRIGAGVVFRFSR